MLHQSAMHGLITAHNVFGRHHWLKSCHCLLAAPLLDGIVSLALKNMPLTPRVADLTRWQHNSQAWQAANCTHAASMNAPPPSRCANEPTTSLPAHQSPSTISTQITAFLEFSWRTISCVTLHAPQPEHKIPSLSLNCCADTSTCQAGCTGGT